MFNRRDFCAASAGALGAVSAGLAQASAATAPYPSKAVRIVVQYQAGGMSDILARVIAEPLSQRLGQPVLVENKPGASGIIGTEFVAKAEPDGHTLLLTIPAPITGNMALFKKLPYDPRKDFRMVSDVAMGRTVLVVNPSLPANDFEGLIELIKASPGKFTMGTWGAGTQPHQIQVFMDKAYGLETLSIPYKGEGPLITDVIGGTLPMTIGSVTAMAPHIGTGKLKALAVVGKVRAKGLPQVPTFYEQGFTDPVLSATGPVTLVAPAKTPDAVIERLSKELQAVLRLPDVQKRIESMGAEIIGNSPAEATKHYAEYWPFVVKLIQDTGVQPE